MTTAKWICDKCGEKRETQGNSIEFYSPETCACGENMRCLSLADGLDAPQLVPGGFDLQETPQPQQCQDCGKEYIQYQIIGESKSKVVRPIVCYECLTKRAFPKPSQPKETLKADGIGMTDPKDAHQPIMQFHDAEQAQNCLAEWKNLLYLNDWIITVKLDQKIDDNQLAVIGYEYSLMAAVIKFADIRKLHDMHDEILKYCAEKILVHELLHIMFDISYHADQTEGREFDAYQHQKTELMARSLIMAKYGLESSWFKS